MAVNKELLERIRTLGFPLFDVEQESDPNTTIADVVKSKDLRLWEGFPVILFNCVEKELFNYGKVIKKLKRSTDKSIFDKLYIVALAIYKTLNLESLWIASLYNSLSHDKKNKYDSILNKLKNNKDINIANYIISSQRLKGIFVNYFTREQSKINSLLSLKEEFDLEYSLSQVFSAKQKELFLKKLKGEKLNKTEKEYFSRVVRKKVIALANPELHRLAQRLL